MTPLRPDLSIVEARLCGPSSALLDRFIHDPGSLSPALRAAIAADESAQDRLRQSESAATEGAAALGPEPESVPPPRPAQLFELHELLDRREASRQFEGLTDPAPGQIRLVETIVGPLGAAEYDLPSPLAVVLSEPVPDEPGVWHGWMASPDPDYASPWDLILEQDIADPLASVVQCWNSVIVYLESTSLVIGQLSAERLAAALALASDYTLGEDVDPSLADPGRRVVREVDGYRVLTGTPLGDESTDPRVEYQLLYHEAGEPLRICARDALGLVDESAESALATAPADIVQWIRDAIGNIVDRFRELAASAALPIAEVPLVPTPASAGETGEGRCLEFAGLLRVNIYGRMTEDFAVIHARLSRLNRDPVTVEVLQGGVTVATEMLDDDQPVMDVPLSGGGPMVIRIVEPVSIDVPLPDL
jgi:hypothetical protein